MDFPFVDSKFLCRMICVRKSNQGSDSRAFVVIIIMYSWNLIFNFYSRLQMTHESPETSALNILHIAMPWNQQLWWLKFYQRFPIDKRRRRLHCENLQFLAVDSLRISCTYNVLYPFAGKLIYVFMSLLILPIIIIVWFFNRTVKMKIIPCSTWNVALCIRLDALS